MPSTLDKHKRLLPLLVCAIFFVTLGFSFRRAWAYTESDFPSYYTAAHMLLKGEPLRSFYEMAEFQRQMDSFVTPVTLGGYIPQTPLTMLPFVPSTSLAMQDAKRLWLIADLCFVGGTVWLLTRITSLRLSGVLGLFILGFGSLLTNLMLGQYYVFILFLLTAAGYFLVTGRDFFAGVILGLICSLKLITAPFLLYFAWRKQWRALAGMGAVLGLSFFVALSLFGWADVAHYLGAILPRSAAGETLNPFHPANGTLTTLLRRILVREPELNPNPLFDFPAVFFFLRVFFELSILVFSLLAFGGTNSARLSYAGFLVALILMSPNTASYTFLLLLLPTALLLDATGPRFRIIVLLCYLLLSLPMRPSWNWMFPKVWLLIAILCLAAVRAGWFPRGRPALVGVSIPAVLSLVIAAFNAMTHVRETNKRWQRVVVEPGAIYSSSPVPIPDGVVYQSIRNGRYKLRLSSKHDLRDFELEGNAFHPVFVPQRNLMRFECIRNRRTIQFFLDPVNGVVSPSNTANLAQARDLTRSPDGRWTACERNSSGSTQIYLFDQTRTVAPIQVTEGHCNSFAPAWERDSSAIVFASDCGRGLGMPALYRAAVKDILALGKK